MPGRPIKALSSTCWLAGCTKETQAAPSFAQWNDQTVLIKRLETKYKGTGNPILAGPRQSRQTERPETKELDPWAQYIEKQGRPVATPHTPAAQTRNVQGPTEERFTQQQHQIDKLRDQITGLETRVTQGAETEKQHHEETQKRFKTMQEQVGTQLETMLTSLKTTIAGSVREQEQRKQSRFERLEELIRGADPPKPSPPRKHLKIERSGIEANIPEDD